MTSTAATFYYTEVGNPPSRSPTVLRPLDRPRFRNACVCVRERDGDLGHDAACAAGSVGRYNTRPVSTPTPTPVLLYCTGPGLL